MRLATLIIFTAALLSSCTKEKLPKDNDSPDPGKQKSHTVKFEFVDYATGEPVKELRLAKYEFDQTNHLNNDYEYFIPDSSTYKFNLLPGYSYSLDVTASNYLTQGLGTYVLPFSASIYNPEWRVADSDTLNLILKAGMLRAFGLTLHSLQKNKYEPLHPEKKYQMLIVEIVTYKTEDTTQEPLHTIIHSIDLREDQLLDIRNYFQVPADFYTKITWRLIAVDDNYYYNGSAEDILATGDLPIEQFSSQGQNELKIEF